MALVAMDGDSSLTAAPWRSVAVDCKAKGATWLRPLASGASVLAYCGADHSTVGFEDGAHFLCVDAEGRATPANLVRDGVAWPPIASNSLVAMASVADMEGEGLLLAGAHALHLLSVSVVESGGEDVLGTCDTVVYANNRQDYMSNLADRDTVVTMDSLGQYSAVGGDNGSIAVLDLKRPEAAPVMKARESFCVNGVALVGRNDTELASVCTGGLLKLWDWRQRAQAVMQLVAPPQEAASLTCVAVRPSTGGTQIVTGSARGVVALWDRRSPDHPLSVFRPHEELVWGMCFDEAGSSLITCSNDGTVAEHEISSGSHFPGAMAQMHWVRRLVEQVMPVNCVAIDHTSGLVAAGTDGNAVYFTTRHEHPRSAPAPAASAARVSAAGKTEEQVQQHRDDELEQQPGVEQGFANVAFESGDSTRISLPPPQATPFGVSPVLGTSGRDWGDWSAPGSRSVTSSAGPLFTPAPSGFGGRLF